MYIQLLFWQTCIVLDTYLCQPPVIPAFRYPFGIVADNIGSTSGMATALFTALHAQQNHATAIPLLLDVNPYYRLLKGCYSVTNADLNIAGALRRTPLLFGAWHAYAHCVGHLSPLA